MIGGKLVLSSVGKNAAVDLVTLSSEGVDIATRLLSAGLVEFEKQKNRAKYGQLVSSKYGQLVWSKYIYNWLVPIDQFSNKGNNGFWSKAAKSKTNLTRSLPQMNTYEAAMNDAKKNRRNRFQYGDFTQDDAKEFGYSK